VTHCVSVLVGAFPRRCLGAFFPVSPIPPFPPTNSGHRFVIFFPASSSGPLLKKAYNPTDQTDRQSCEPHEVVSILSLNQPVTSQAPFTLLADALNFVFFFLTLCRPSRFELGLPPQTPPRHQPLLTFFSHFQHPTGFFPAFPEQALVFFEIPHLCRNRLEVYGMSVSPGYKIFLFAPSFHLIISIAPLTPFFPDLSDDFYRPSPPINNLQ